MSTSSRTLCVYVRYTRAHIERCIETKIVKVQKSFKYRNFDRIVGEPMEFKCNIFQAFNTLQLSQEVQTFTLETWWDIWDFHGKNHSLWMFNDIYWIKDNATRMLGECQTRFSFTTKFWKRTIVIYWSWSREEVVLYQWRQTPRCIWTMWLKGCCWNSKKVIAQFSVLRAHCPEVDSKTKGHSFCFRKHDSDCSETGATRYYWRVKDLKGRSTCWTILIVLP